MKPPIIPQFRDQRFREVRISKSRARYGERGVTMVLVAVAMVSIIGIAAWSIDLITLYLAREEAQRAADTAALTAARIISVSGITGDGQPISDSTNWQSICGTNGLATHAAQAAGGQNSVGSQAATVTVLYATGDGTNKTSDCSSLSQVFAVNPLVIVQVQRTNLTSFFSRIWGNTGNTISAKAVAEAFNPSASDVNTNGGATGAVTPVQPRCVKPWMVPNQNPLKPAGCLPGACNTFVSVTNGSITNAGISVSGVGNVIGETFSLFADCNASNTCVMPTLPQPQANVSTGLFTSGPPPVPPNLEYLPGEVLSPPIAVPACAAISSGQVANYRPAVAGCDQSTQYQCGVNRTDASPANAIELQENPGGADGDTALGLACSATNQTGVPLVNQDVLDTGTYPFKITAGSANPLKIPSGTQITASNQIVSLPIYDDSVLLTFSTNRAEVTIVGFLQVFINAIDGNGNVSVTVLNVSGCGNGTGPAPNNAVNGSSPVPVRLITPP
jgi:Flp pilus assembly protein TadG